MNNERWLNGLAIFASGYVKRWMENNYDALMRTPPAHMLMEQGKPTRYAIEASLYALLAYADQQWTSTTPLSKFIREVVRDAPSEVSKRLVNGFRDQVVSDVGKESPEQTQSVEQVLLRLDDETLSGLLSWLARTTPVDRNRIRLLLPTLSNEELQKAARLSPADLDALVDTSPPATKKESPSERPPSRFATAIKGEIEGATRRIDDQLKELRSRSKT